MKWTQEREDFLIENANLGIERLTKLFNRMFGTHASENTIKTRASHLRISLRRYEICPQCGAMVREFAPRSTVCKACHVKNLRDRAIDQNREIERRIKATERQIEKDRRKYDTEYAKVRKQNQRANERLSNLLGQDAGCGDSANPQR